MNNNFFKEMKKYIKKHKISLIGGSVALVVAGISITLFPFEKLIDDNTYISNKTIVHEIIDSLEKNDVSNDIVVDDNDVKEDITTPTDNNVVIPEVTIPTVNEVVKDEVTSEEIVTDDKTYITLKRSNGVIETLELETYLIGVVGSEMPASFNSEALKAQAIVARTYALRKDEAGLVLTDTVSDQVYKDINQLKAMWGNEFDKYYQKVLNAVNSTSGLVITYNNQLIDAVYHSTSNGYTVDAVDVWGNSVPYLQSVSSSFDTSASSYYREVTYDYDSFNQKLNTSLSKDSSIIIIRDINNRVTNITIDNISFDGVDFRNMLGVRSTDFDLILTDNFVQINTRGYGHGVGMSQYGANGMANNGYSYSDIINHYYQGVIIKQQ